MMERDYLLKQLRYGWQHAQPRYQCCKLVAIPWTIWQFITAAGVGFFSVAYIVVKLRCLCLCGICRRAVQSSLSALLSASLTSEANNLERIAVLEGGLSGVAKAASAAQSALADAASQGNDAVGHL